MAFFCKDCNEAHEGLPDLGSDAPDPYLAMSDEERKKRAELSSDLCILEHDEQTDYFIRGVVYIPIHGEAEPWGIGIWLTQSEKNFERYVEQEEEMEPTVGFIANNLAFYDKDTMFLKGRAHFSGDKMRPSIELEPTDHPFAVDQREGITLEKAWKIVHRFMD